MDTRSRYEKELHRITDELAQMGALLLEMIRQVQTLMQQEQISDINYLYVLDRQVNEYELKLVHRSVRMLNLEQPVASDLRHLIAILRSVSDLERIGDHIVHIAKILRKDADTEQRLPIDLFPSMLKWVAVMLEQGLAAFSLRSTDLARSVIENDKTVDEMHKRVLHQIMNGIQNHPKLFESAINMLFLSRFIERIGDHIASACEWCLYSVNGQLQEEHHFDS